MEAEANMTDANLRRELNDLKSQMAMLVEAMTALTAHNKGKASIEDKATGSGKDNPEGQTGQPGEVAPPAGTTPIVFRMNAPEPVEKVEEVGTTSNAPVESGKWAALENRLKAIEGSEAFGFTNPQDLCLVSGVIMPKKFKVPDFEKYKGATCPKTHLTMYCRKMAEVAHDEKLLMHCFQDSLTGAALKWYMQLDNSKVKSWKELADAFMRQYKYNMESAPDRMDLQNMEKRNNESFKAYAQRWRELAAQVQPPLSEKELASTFIRTLKAPYFEYALGNVSSEFADIVTVGDRVEQFIKQGLLSDSKAEAKKGLGGARRKEPEATQQVATLVVPSRPVPASPSRATPAPAAKPTFEKKRYDEPWVALPLPLTQIYEGLIEGKLITPINAKPFEPPFPHWYKAEETCGYHSGVAGHSLENCVALKRKIQYLIKQGWLKFEDDDVPNVQNNPLPNHGGAGVNAILEELEFEPVRRVDQISTPLEHVYGALVKEGYLQPIPIGEGNCVCCGSPDGHSLRECQVFKNELQTLLTLGILQVEQKRGPSKKEVCVTHMDITHRPVVFRVNKKASPQEESSPHPQVIMTVPKPFEYKSTRAVPWSYKPSWKVVPPTSVGEERGKASKVETQEAESYAEKGVNPDLLVHSAEATRGMTRSGRLYTSEEVDRLRKEKGVLHDREAEPGAPSSSADPTAPVSDEAAQEFLRLVKQSDYSVVDQLKKTPSKISIWSLIAASAAHKEELEKILSEAYVPENIPVEKFTAVVNHVHAINLISFSDEEIDAAGTGHTKAL